jgi:hypothetical protein
MTKKITFDEDSGSIFVGNKIKASAFRLLIYQCTQDY